MARITANPAITSEKAMDVKCGRRIRSAHCADVAADLANEGREGPKVALNIVLGRNREAEVFPRGSRARFDRANGGLEIDKIIRTQSGEEQLLNDPACVVDDEAAVGIAGNPETGTREDASVDRITAQGKAQRDVQFIFGTITVLVGQIRRRHGPDVVWRYSA